MAATGRHMTALITFRSAQARVGRHHSASHPEHSGALPIDDDFPVAIRPPLHFPVEINSNDAGDLDSDAVEARASVDQAQTSVASIRRVPTIAVPAPNGAGLVRYREFTGVASSVSTVSSGQLVEELVAYSSWSKARCSVNVFTRRTSGRRAVNVRDARLRTRRTMRSP